MIEIHHVLLRLERESLLVLIFYADDVRPVPQHIGGASYLVMKLIFQRS